jgi:hypothetical protein
MPRGASAACNRQHDDPILPVGWGHRDPSMAGVFTGNSEGGKP